MKKLFYLLLLPIISLLSSCTFDDSGNAHIAGWFWIVVVGIIVLFIYALISSEKDTKKAKDALAERNQNFDDFKFVGKYVGGHPDFDKEITRVSVKDSPDLLSFYDQASQFSMPYHRFDIPKSKIKEITVEDASSIEKKLTVGRLFLVGVFAFAWKKKKKNELAFIVIDWNDGRFEHATTFAIEEKDAFQKANSVRNQLIKYAR